MKKNTSIEKVSMGEINALLNHFGAYEGTLGTVAGLALIVELKMRWIGQLSKPVQDRLRELGKKFPRESSNYWDCRLVLLDQAIVEEFGDQLLPEERQLIEAFRPLRNKLLHADFVALMLALGIEPTGRKILPGGGRDPVASTDVKEAFLSIIRNTEALNKLRIRANEVLAILDKLILSFAYDYEEIVMKKPLFGLMQ